MGVAHTRLRQAGRYTRSCDVTLTLLCRQLDMFKFLTGTVHFALLNIDYSNV